MSFYHVFKRLADFDKSYVGHPKALFPNYPLRKWQEKALDSIEKQSATIELLRDGQVQRVHFYRPFVFINFQITIDPL